MTYDEFLSAAVVLSIANGYDPRRGMGATILNRAIEALLGPVEDTSVLRRAIRQAAGQQIGPTLWLQKGREAYEKITHGST